jgi:histidinol-phosphate aminotransferase
MLAQHFEAEPASALRALGRAAVESPVGLRLDAANLPEQFRRHGETVAWSEKKVKLGANLYRSYNGALMRRLWRDVLDRVAPYDAGKSLDVVARELGLDSVLRLSANENPLGPSPRVVEAIQREASRAHLYPDGGCTAVREALASRLGVSTASIVVGNGADELLAMLARASLDPDDEVVVPHPAFEPYGTEATLAGATVVASPLKGYDQDLDDMLGRVTARTKCVIICTPHNPAATIVRRRPLERFLDALGADPPLVILDEAYLDFCDDDDTADGVVLQRRYPTLVSLRTFSKIAGLAGLRIGYAIARPEHVERLNRVRAPYNVNRLAQVAAVAALADPEHLEHTRRVVLRERPRLQAALAERGAPSPRSHANFMLARVDDRAAALRTGLFQAGILVRDGAGVGFPGHLRIAVGTAEQNARLLDAWDGVRG